MGSLQQETVGQHRTKSPPTRQEWRSPNSTQLQHYLDAVQCSMRTPSLLEPGTQPDPKHRYSEFSGPAEDFYDNHKREFFLDDALCAGDPAEDVRIRDIICADTTLLC
jgi:hypothetical protein